MKDIEQIVKVTWYDSCQKELTNEDISALIQSVGKEYLVTNYTYGRLVKKSKHIVAVMTEDSTTNEKNVTVIPTGWVQKIEYYRKR